MQPQRHSIRLPDYDYSQPGDYFITIDTKGWKPLFGRIENGKISLSSIGIIVREEWLATPQHRPYVELGTFAIMPNHFHAILTLNDDDMGAHTKNERFGVPVSGSVPTIIRAFKAAVTRRVNELPNLSGMIVWHRNYYEHVICTEREYINIDAYIESNPTDWSDQRKPWLG